MSPNRPVLLPAVTALVIALTGCSSGQAAGRSHPHEQPARVEVIAGTQLHRILLSKDAARRIGVQTQALSSSGIPSTAVVYDAQGRTWAYTSPAPLTYVRTPVTIGTLSKGEAVLTSGPPPGTQVVTVGAEELLGTEFGVGGEQ